LIHALGSQVLFGCLKVCTLKCCIAIYHRIDVDFTLPCAAGCCSVLAWPHFCMPIKCAHTQAHTHRESEKALYLSLSYLQCGRGGGKDCAWQDVWIGGGQNFDHGFLWHAKEDLVDHACVHACKIGCMLQSLHLLQPCTYWSSHGKTHHWIFVNQLETTVF
jgi:hypothetical protein